MGHIEELLEIESRTDDPEVAAMARMAIEAIES